jgi:Tol biopolymer transport system component
MKFSCVILMAGMMLTMVALGQRNESSEVMLGAGLHQEEVEANCKEAIKMYEEVVQRKGSPSNVAARAQLHIAICQEKLGKQEARMAYEAVLKYADQPDIVADARSRIAGLAGVEAKRSRKLDTPNEVGYETLSPDGQWLGGTDWIKGDLVLTHVATGETRRLIQGRFKDKFRMTWGECPLLSPDQSQVAYLWFDLPTAGSLGATELRIMSNQPGAKPRTVFSNENYSNMYPIGWSRDSKLLLASLVKGSPLERGSLRSYLIAWVSVNDGSIRVVKTLERWRIEGSAVSMALSPDGQYIAYSARVRENAPESRIYIISSVDGAPIGEMGRGTINEQPLWINQRILFRSNGSGVFAHWSSPVVEGGRPGVPSVITGATGAMGLIGVAPSGTFYFQSASGNLNPLKQIFVADMDPVAGRIRGPATESILGSLPSWSPDGQWLAFQRPNTFVIHSMLSGKETEFKAPGSNRRAVWYLDGVQSAPVSRIQVSSGEPIETTSSVRLPLGELSPDGNTLYRLLRPIERQRSSTPEEGIEVFDVTTGQRKSRLRVPANVVDFALSPDGKTFGLVDRPEPEGPYRLARVGIDGSNFRYLYSGVAWFMTQLAWSRDNRSLFFVQEDMAPSRIMRISAEGGQPEFTGISTQDLTSFDLAPDGSRIAYAVDLKNREVWAHDNLLGKK